MCHLRFKTRERERDLHDYSQTTVAIVHLHKSTMDSLKQVRWYLLSRRSIHTSWRSRLWYWPHLLPKFPPASLGPMVRTPLATAVDWVNVQIPSNHESKLFWSGSTLQLWHLMMPSSSSSSASLNHCCYHCSHISNVAWIEETHWAPWPLSRLQNSVPQRFKTAEKCLAQDRPDVQMDGSLFQLGPVNSWKFQQKQKLVQDPWR